MNQQAFNVMSDLYNRIFVNQNPLRTYWSIMLFGTEYFSRFRKITSSRMNR